MKIMALILLFTLSILNAETAEAHNKKVRQHKPEYIKRLPVETALVRENRLAREQGLPRINKEETVDEFVERAGLVPVPPSTEIFSVEKEKDKDLLFLYLTPEASGLLKNFGNLYSSDLGDTPGKRLRVVSLLRPCWYQNLLYLIGKSNAHCKEADPDHMSTHLTGATFDISKKTLTRAEFERFKKICDYLYHLGVIHPIYERGGIHILVLRALDPGIDLAKVAENFRNPSVANAKKKKPR